MEARSPEALTAPTRFVIIASSRDMSRKVFNSPSYVKPCLVDVAAQLLRPDSWVFLDGKEHVEYRKGLNPLFNRQALELYVNEQESVFDDYFAHFVRKTQAAGGQPTPFMPMFREFMCANSLRVFAGHYMPARSGQTIADPAAPGPAALDLVNFPVILPFTRPWYGKSAADMVMHEFAKCAAMSKAKMRSGGTPTCILDTWVANMYASQEYTRKTEAGETVPPEEKPAHVLRMFNDWEIALTIFTFLFASQDATSSACTWLFQIMADRPELLDKVREENLAARGGDRHQRCTLEMVENLPYTRAVVKETLRYRPPVIMVPYTVKQPFPLSPTYTAPKGAMLAPSCWPALHDPEVYPQPDEFDPDRWITGTAEAQQKNWLVFGTGPHYCLGQTYATNMLIAMIGKASMHVDWTHKVTNLSEEVKVFATIFPMVGLPTTFRRIGRV